MVARFRYLALGLGILAALVALSIYAANPATQYRWRFSVPPPQGASVSTCVGPDGDTVFAIKFQNEEQSEEFRHKSKFTDWQEGKDTYFRILKTAINGADLEQNLLNKGWGADAGTYIVYEGVMKSGKAVQVFVSQDSLEMLVLIAAG